MPKGQSTVELGKGKPGSVVGITWGYPPGVPTPNPDLSVEVAPGIPSGEIVSPEDDGPDENVPEDNGSQVGLSWKYPPGGERFLIRQLLIAHMQRFHMKNCIQTYISSLL